MRLWTRRFFPEEIVTPEKDARFGDFGEITAGRWNPHAWWYEHGRDGSTALFLEAVLQAWGVTPADVAEHFDRLHIASAEGRISMDVRGMTDTVLIEGYRLRRKGAKVDGDGA
jgi:hypothetical protein